MDRNNVAIVILNWNGKSYLEDFLPLVIKNSSTHARIIVADNGSTDDSVEFIQKFSPDIEIIKFDRNLGYTGGYNKALKMVNAKYYVLLNSDIEVSENWLSPVLELMEKDENIGACQPKIMQYVYHEIFEYAGAAGGFIDFLGYPFCRGRIFNTLEKDKGQFDENNKEIFWASGACLIVRADLFHKLNGFDEHFFAHMEEIDLCWRLKHYGKQIACCAESVVYHVGGGTLPKTNPKKTYLNFRNSLWVLAKNLPAKKFYKRLPLRIFLDKIAAFKFLMDGNFKDAVAVIKAHFAFVKKLGYMRKQYKSVTGQKVSGIYSRSIVWDYFIGKKKYFQHLPKDKFS